MCITEKFEHLITTMTSLALNLTESSSIGANEGPVSAMKTQTTPVPRFSLRKRSVNSDRPKAMLSTVNSAFLSGLFADVAKTQVEFENADSQDISPEDSDPRTNQSLPAKKSRVSMTKARGRSCKSMMSLRDALVSPPSSPDPPSRDTVNLFDVLSFPATPVSDMERKDSLLFQLHCVSSSSSNESSVAPSTKMILDAATLEFPHLPATISATSCNTLTRNSSDLQSSTTEKSQKESYGWFVEMDEEEENVHVPTSTTTAPYVSTSVGELTFKAPTASKASNHDAEVEWAKAADTVDDVLGDFF
jgi:hypothetical protein